ncbi:GntR family transcriptional regulator [Antarcticirhabdus aurantiaca]|uniref:GntR family transcriptional regulator n=1 Tax=Antarcticirhabdus aurantiaca TaxID=2606717 RepID=A0ACD4NL93_9HYPH|nr:GntR family transcriptional regulator [Antarcticirhabdus aurantiaca]WAJ27599.1 GntR family transcriptional regulator [Jeongeuplla avenae]
MKPPARSSFRAIKDEIARRIGERAWKPGSLIPGEEALAAEFGAARATVNRALQELARAGLIERKRKVGTRVSMHPPREARFAIPLVAEEIRASGAAYGYRLISRTERPATAEDAARFDVPAGETVLHLACLHLAGGRPYQFEDRLINPAAAPRVLEQDFETHGPNEWLVGSAPFSRGEFTFFADLPSAEEARHLAVEPNAPVLVGERRTWLVARPVTAVRMVHPRTHRLTSLL